MLSSLPSLPPLPTLPITSIETLEKCKTLSVGSSDIFIASFPKSGTTWMQNIVIQLLLAQRQWNGQEELLISHISQYAPFYEIDAHWEGENLSSDLQESHKALGCRVFNTHLRWDMLPQGAKYIYVVRDGRDVLTSFYHHLSNQHEDDGGFQGTFQEFFDQFLHGSIAYGKWSHHLASWMPQIETGNPNILLVQYENLKQDLKGQIIRISNFMNLAQATEPPPFLDQVLERVSFDYMQTHQHLFHPISVRWRPGYNFIRSGTVGDYKSLFTDTHKKEFMEFVLADLGGGIGENKEGEVPRWLYQVGFVNNIAKKE